MFSAPDEFRVVVQFALIASSAEDPDTGISLVSWSPTSRRDPARVGDLTFLVKSSGLVVLRSPDMPAEASGPVTSSGILCCKPRVTEPLQSVLGASLTGGGFAAALSSGSGSFEISS